MVRVPLGAQMQSNDKVPEPEAEVCEVVRVRIRSLVAADSPRIDGEDDRHIALLAQMSTPLPPILVQKGTMRVIDGMHRLRAAMLLGHETIVVRLFDGTDAEAFVAAVKANVGHGLPLTLADRKAAVLRVVVLYPERSDRWIASVTGLAPGTVAAIRRRVPGGDCESGRRIGRDGRVRPVNGASGRKRAIDALAANPDASLREIARMAGVSPQTVRAVRKRTPGSEGGKESSEVAVAAVRRRDRDMLMRKLRLDPSLRFNETGRKLLRWLDVQASGPGELNVLTGQIPLHCLYLLAEVVRGYADEWLEAASRLQERTSDQDEGAC
jgi:ParB-like chromosome segregation protein Spo0J